MSQLRQRENDLNQLGVKVAVVTFEAGPTARAYLAEKHLPWPLLVDGTRSLYSAYGMLHGKWRDIYGPASWWAYAKLLTRGRRFRYAQSDFHQLGGDVMIDPNGIVRLHHVGSGPADRPSIDSLLSVVNPDTPF